MPKFPKDTLKPQIVTGLEALGRGQDLNKLQAFLQYLQPLGPEVLTSSMNIDDYIARLAASLGIDTQGLIKSPEQKQQEQMMAQQAQEEAMQQQQMMSIAEKATPAMAKGAAEYLGNSAE